MFQTSEYAFNTLIISGALTTSLMKINLSDIYQHTQKHTQLNRINKKKKQPNP